MDKIDVLKLLKDKKIVSVIRIDSDHPDQVIDAIVEGGVSFIEITLTMKHSLELIESLSRKYDQHGDVVIGAGTVLDAVSARLAILQGAAFIVAPTFNEEVAKICALYRVAYIPGVHNPNDIESALRSGVDVLKLFPASTLEPFVIKEFKGPFPQAQFIISGKVTRDNAVDWLDAGAMAVCVGSLLTNQEKNGYAAITETTQSFCRLVG